MAVTCHSGARTEGRERFYAADVAGVAQAGAATAAAVLDSTSPQRHLRPDAKLLLAELLDLEERGDRNDLAPRRDEQRA